MSSADNNLATSSGHVVHPPPPYDLCGRGPFYNGGEHLRDVPCSGTVGYTVAYCRRPTPDGTPSRPTLSLHWLPPPSLRAQSS
jgi:hypothetical protein